MKTLLDSMLFIGGNELFYVNKAFLSIK